MLTSKLEASQQSIRRRWDANFTWVVNTTTPWAPITRPLAESNIALLSTCGFYRLDMHLPFDAWHDLGDPSFREIHVDTPPERLRIAHSHYDHKHVVADPNVALPIPHFRTLVEQGVIGRLFPWAYSFMGYLPQTSQLAREMAPAVARRLRAEGADAAFLTPCWPLCQQSVGLIARAIEEQGIPTVCVVMNRDIAENVGIPRALYVRFPYGAPLGPAGAADFQMRVIRAALAVLVTAPQAGSIIEADLEWTE